MKKLIVKVVTNCMNCDYLNSGHCTKEKPSRELQLDPPSEGFSITIPEWCPLPDAPEEKKISPVVTPVVKAEPVHEECLDCDDNIMLHRAGETHCTICDTEHEWPCPYYKGEK